jgi:hypothetical protein
MAAQKTITINGRLYDAVTGLPVTGKPTPAPATPSPAKVASASKVDPVVAPKPALKPAAKRPSASRTQAASSNVHSNVQKSQTLMRRVTKKPAAPHKVVRRSQPGRHMDIARNTNVAKFAPHPVVKPEVKAAPVARSVARPTAATPADRPAQVHPAAHRALAKAQAKKQPAVKAAAPATAKTVKDAAISKALATPQPKAPKKEQNKWVRRLIIVGSIVLVILLALFLIYKFIPGVSVGIAAAQAGIQASYPDYTPDGYALSQPVTYSDGEVNLEFHSNSNETTYAINQKRSSWDSSAVLDNVVKSAVGENYTTTKERGLTIYTYEKGAAWVNGGILFTISGDAPLSGDQVRRLATSL